MNYNFAQDLKAMREILDLTQVELAEQLGIDQKTISRNEVGRTEPSSKLLEDVYSYAFDKKIRINKLKEMLWNDNLENGHKLLFHRAKSVINGELDVHTANEKNIF